MKAYTANYIQSGGTGAFSEYYTAQYDSAIFRPWLKRNLVFAQHNLAMDTSFNELHLIVCRNVMIYFNRDLQSRVLDLFGQPGAARLPLPGQQGVAEGDTAARPPTRSSTPTSESIGRCAGEPTAGRGGGSHRRLRRAESAARHIAGHFPAPLAIVQHQGSPGSGLATLLQRYSALVVTDAEDKEDLLPKRRLHCPAATTSSSSAAAWPFPSTSGLPCPPVDRRPVRVGRRRLRPVRDWRILIRPQDGAIGLARSSNAADGPSSRIRAMAARGDARGGPGEYDRRLDPPRHHRSAARRPPSPTGQDTAPQLVARSSQ